MKNLTKLLLIILAAASFSFVSAQKKDYSGEPGYVEFGDMSALDNSEEGTEVILEEHLLKMVAKLSHNEDPQVATLLDGLKLVKVYQFQYNTKNESKLTAKAASIEKDLSAKNWDRIIRQKSKTENTNVYIKTNNEQKIVGLAITNLKRNEEAVFINIVGNIDLEKIGSLSGKLGMPQLNSLKKKKNLHEN